jgi:putative aminopeptidase FrvX
MGKGVVLNYGPDKHRLLNNELRKLAKWHDTKFQVIAGKAGGTNTNSIQMMSDNCATSLLSIPCRYMHSSTHEMVNKDDINACIDLIVNFINETNLGMWSGDDMLL